MLICIFVSKYIIVSREHFQKKNKDARDWDEVRDDTPKVVLPQDEHGQAVDVAQEVEYYRR